MGTADDDDQVAYGAIYTHVSCPYCDDENQYEDDCNFDEVNCESCGKAFTIQIR